MKLRAVLIIFFFSLFSAANSQSRFMIEDGKSYFKSSFELVNDLVIVPVELNGLELSFLLDTGVTTTILFGLDANDSIPLENAEVIFLKGLGEGAPFRALKSTGNRMKIGSAINPDMPVYIVFNSPVNISNRMGVPIHGIIGYDFFKDFVLEFNYSRRQMKVYEPSSYSLKKCRRCNDFDLTFDRNKPYISVTADINDQEDVPLNLLVDSGSGDALWIFKNEEKKIRVPESNFEDFLGFGMGGSVYGLRSRIEGLQLGGTRLDQITASFPDTLYFNNLQTFKIRNGSLGSQVLRRFHTTFDYSRNFLRLKPNGNTSEPFEYDMSGVVIAHNGYTIIKDLIQNPISGKAPGDFDKAIVDETVYQSKYKVKFSLEPQYEIAEVRPDSPAEKAGLRSGDILLKINGRPAYRFNLSQITTLFSSKEGKKIRLHVEREGEEKNISFYLRRVI